MNGELATLHPCPIVRAAQLVLVEPGPMEVNLKSTVVLPITNAMKSSTGGKLGLRVRSKMVPGAVVPSGVPEPYVRVVPLPEVIQPAPGVPTAAGRSEERRVGEEC